MASSKPPLSPPALVAFDPRSGDDGFGALWERVQRQRQRRRKETLFDRRSHLAFATAAKGQGRTRRRLFNERIHARGAVASAVTPNFAAAASEQSRLATAGEPIDNGECGGRTRHTADTATCTLLAVAQDHSSKPVKSKDVQDCEEAKQVLHNSRGASFWIDTHSRGTDAGTPTLVGGSPIKVPLRLNGNCSPSSTLAPCLTASLSYDDGFDVLRPARQQQQPQQLAAAQTVTRTATDKAESQCPLEFLVDAALDVNEEKKSKIKTLATGSKNEDSATMTVNTGAGLKLTGKMQKSPPGLEIKFVSEQDKHLVAAASPPGKSLSGIFKLEISLGRRTREERHQRRLKNARFDIPDSSDEKSSNEIVVVKSRAAQPQSDKIRTNDQLSHDVAARPGKEDIVSSSIDTKLRVSTRNTRRPRDSILTEAPVFNTDNVFGFAATTRSFKRSHISAVNTTMKTLDTQDKENLGSGSKMSQQDLPPNATVDNLKVSVDEQVPAFRSALNAHVPRPNARNGHNSSDLVARPVSTASPTSSPSNLAGRDAVPTVHEETKETRIEHDHFAAQLKNDLRRKTRPKRAVASRTTSQSDGLETTPVGPVSGVENSASNAKTPQQQGLARQTSMGSIGMETRNSSTDKKSFASAKKRSKLDMAPESSPTPARGDAFDMLPGSFRKGKIAIGHRFGKTCQKLQMAHALQGDYRDKEILHDETLKSQSSTRDAQGEEMFDELPGEGISTNSYTKRVPSVQRVPASCRNRVTASKRAAIRSHRSRQDDKREQG